MFSLFEVVLVVCMSGSASQCVEERMAFSIALPAEACLMKAIPDTRLWEFTHPGWYVRSTSCRPPRRHRHA